MQEELFTDILVSYCHGIAYVFQITETTQRPVTKYGSKVTKTPGKRSRRNENFMTLGLI
jgi:hypothetical protein